MRIEGELEQLYANRFSTAERIEKHRLWKTLCESYFSQYVPSEGTVLDLGAGYCDLGAVRFATGIFTLPEAIALARPCESELLVGHGVGPDIAGRSR